MFIKLKPSTEVLSRVGVISNSDHVLVNIDNIVAISGVDNQNFVYVTCKDNITFAVEGNINTIEMLINDHCV